MTVDLILGDCLTVLPTLADNSINLIVTDPPYYCVKDLPWDRQWDTPAAFLKWMDRVLEQFYRVLKPNGSLYLFASPKMAARVEVLTGQWFEVLNRIVWAKPRFSTKAEMFRKGDLRLYFPVTEYVFFAEHHGADGYAKGEAGWVHKCDELRGFVFEPLRMYLDGERRRAGIGYQKLAQYVGVTPTMIAQHYFSRSRWGLPTQVAYRKMRECLNTNDPGGRYLRREYEDLRREYEELRRPFTVSAEVPYTDVWTYATVQAYRGKHPCEKPLDMLLDIVRASSKPGDVVGDFFFGSGNTAIATQQLGRDFVGSELSEHWHARATRRIEAARDEVVQLGLEG